MRKFLLLVLCAGVIFLAFSSCAGNTDGDTGKTTGNADNSTTVDGTPVSTTAVTDEPTILDTLPSGNFGGRQFTLLTVKDYNATAYFVYNENNGENVSSTAYKRTQFINTNYGIDLKVVEVNKFYDTLTAFHAAGGDDYDLLFPSATSALSGAITNGYMADLTDCEALTLTGEWYNSNQVESYTTNDKLYLAVSDYSITYQGFAGIVYNKDLLKTLSLETDVYDVVKDKTWTVDYLMEIAQKYGADLDSSSSYDVNDSYGLVYHDGYTDRWMYALGERITDKGTDNKFKLAFNVDHLTLVAEKILNMTSNQHVYRGTSTNAKYPDSDMFTVFRNQHAIFITFDVGVLYPLLRSLSFKIGFLPFPKFDEKQEDYITFCASGFFAIPSSIKTIDESAVVLEALSRYSYLNMRQSFFNSILLGRLSESESDYKMLELMHNNKQFDIGFTLDTDRTASGILKTVVLDAGGINISRYLDSKKSVLDDLINKINSLNSNK